MTRKGQRPRMVTERSPLLGAESPFEPAAHLPAAPPPPYSEIQKEIDTVDYRIGREDEGATAPPSSPFTDTIRCDVCNYPISKTLAKNKRVITCPRCQEVTALGQPEKGKKYLRCPECQRLLIITENASKAICPKPECKTTIDVKTGKPCQSRKSRSAGTANENIAAEPQYRITCGYCRSAFVQATIPTNPFRCPQCRRKSHIGEGSGRVAAIIYIGLGLACIVLTLVLMATTMGLRHNAGYWYIYMILLSLGICFIIWGLWNLCMKQSVLEVTNPVV